MVDEPTADIREPGPFAGIDFSRQLVEWRAWPEDRRPEEHRAVAPHHRTPPEDAEFEILGRISVRKTWSDTRRIQCNVCGNPHKFENEGYVACYDDGWWYIVGPQCGSETHKGRVNSAINAHLLREAEFTADEDLRKFMSFRVEWRAYFEAIERATLVLYAVSKNLAVQDKAHTAICNAARTDGFLVVDRMTQTGDRAPKTYGRVAGASFLIAQPSPIAKLRALKKDLSFMLRSTSHEEMNAALVSHYNAGTLATVSAALRDQLRTVAELREQILDARSFVAEENLKRLIDWSSARGTTCPAPLKASRLGDALYLPIGDSRLDSHEIDLRPLLAFAAEAPYRR